MSTKAATKDRIDPDTGEVLEEPRTLVTTSGGALAASPEDNFDYGADAGKGFENQTSEDIAIPFWVLLQPGSPEVQDEDGPARPGMWLNKTTGELVSGKEGLTFIPAWTDHLMVEWRDRDNNGGGFVAQHAIDSEIARRARAEQPFGSYNHPDFWTPELNEDQLKKVNDLIETFYVYGLAIDNAGIPSPGVIAFASSHIKGYKDWQFRTNTVTIPLPGGRTLTGKQLPLWAFSYRLRSAKKEDGQYTWFVPVVSFAGETAADSRVPPGTSLYLLARSVYEGISSGATRAATETLSRDSAARTDASSSAADLGDERVPF